MPPLNRSDNTDRISRRRWLELMGASLALAGAGGCRWEKEEILPFDKRPADRTPGIPQRFATAMDLAGSAVGLLVTTLDGRPVKIEGNPDHPDSLGATDAITQAALLQLYDPDRSQNVYHRDGEREMVQTWDDFAAFVRERFAELRRSGANVFRVLSPASSSPTLAAMRDRLPGSFPQSRWHEYEPLAARPAPYRVQLDLPRADVIVCLDADLFGDHPAAVRYARQFAEGRDAATGSMNRLYVAESCFSITGAAADHRHAVQSRRIAALARHLLKRAARPSTAAGVSAKDEFEPFLSAVVGDLHMNRGRSVVVAGLRQTAEVHALVHEINAALENLGGTVTYTAEPAPLPGLAELVAEMKAGKVGTLLILGGNPVYDAPADLAFADALGKVDAAIHLGLYRNETSRRCSWHLPQAHFLESWSDARSYDGTYSVVQPMIAPLYGGKSAIELTAMILGEGSRDALESVRDTFKRLTGEEDFYPRWQRALRDGLVPGTRHATIDDAQRQPTVFPRAGAPPSDAGADGLELVFCRDPKVYDGRFANNGWLQEMPGPMTRITWGNAALIGPATAKDLGVENETIVRLKFKGRPLEIPAYVMPGQAEGSVVVALGYGRTAAGHVGGLAGGGLAGGGVDPVGVDVYQLRTSDAMYFGGGLSLQPTGRKFPLAGVQDHFAIDTAGRKQRARCVDVLIREATLAEYLRHPDFAQHAVHHPPLESLWEEHEPHGYRWGMTIDLSKCIGCGACVVACQAENNIPVVGRERILQGREMHWLRVDRYFRGQPGEGQLRAAVQPVACQHCELAPCEQVCPVNATVHNREGLNVMVYNRCVGTRYCANNCPFKVRRFNYFNYHAELKEPANEVAKMVYNPQVTVRSRGVMEKCTYCTQRIEAAKIRAKNRRRPIRDGEIRTACQQVCPSGAITFGDLSDEKSRVARSAAGSRSYAMLAELNIKPRTTYLARIRNPNPQWEEEMT